MNQSIPDSSQGTVGRGAKVDEQRFLVTFCFRQCRVSTFQPLDFHELFSSFSSGAVEVLFVHQRIAFGAMDSAVAVLWWTVKGVEFQLPGV